MRIRHLFRRRPTQRKFARPRAEPLEGRVLFAAGELDPTFGGGDGVVTHPGAGITNFADAAAVQSDGKVVVVGRSKEEWGANDFTVSRYNANGTLDATFGDGGRVYTDFAGGDDFATAVVITPGGKILVAGTRDVDGPNEIAVARYNPDGSLDATFDGDGKRLDRVTLEGAEAFDMALQADGKVVVAATAFSNASNSPDIAVVRYNENGSRDATFEGDGAVIVHLNHDDHADAVAVRGDGHVVVAGTTYDATGTARFLLLGLNPDGTRDAAFGAGGVALHGPDIRLYSPGVRLLAQPGNKVVLSHSLSPETADPNVAVTRFTAAGAIDPTFGSNGRVVIQNPGTDYPAGLAQQADGKLVVGIGDGDGQDGDFAVARLSANGAPDPTFSGDGVVQVALPQRWVGVADVVVQPGGRIVTAGTAPNGGGFDFVLAGVTSAGAFDPAFRSDNYPADQLGLAGTFFDVVVQPDGRIVAAGRTVRRVGQGTLDVYVARFLADGSLDNSFGTGGRAVFDFGGHDTATRLALQPDGKILVNGTQLIRLTSDGRLDTSFASGGFVQLSSSLFPVAGLAVQPDGRVLVSSPEMRSVSRYTAGGQLDTTFGQGGHVTNFGSTGVDPNNITDVAWQPTTGKIIVGGDGFPPDEGRDWIVWRLNTDGSFDTTFGGGTGYGRSDYDQDLGGRIAVRPSDGLIAMAANEDDDDADLLRFGQDGQSFGTYRLPYYPGSARDVAIAPDGKIVIVTWDEGYPDTPTGPDIRVDRFNADGTPDTTYYPLRTDVFGNSEDIPYGVAVAPDGDVLVAGTSGGTPVLIRYQGSGAPDPVQLYSDGTLIITGTGGADTLSMDNSSSTLTIGLNNVVRTVPVASIRTINADLGAGNDTGFIDSTLPRTTVSGGAGDDTLRGGAGVQNLAGGDGNDTLLGGSGFDRLAGDAGDDYFDGGAGGDAFIGGSGNDTVDYSARTADLRITTGDHQADDGETNEYDDLDETVEIVKGGSGNDQIFDGSFSTRNALVGGTRNAFYGNGGNDTLGGGSGVDAHFGGAGDDVFQAGDVSTNPSTPNTLYEGDYFNGGSGNDTIDYSNRERAFDDLSVSLDGVANDGRRAGPEVEFAEGDNVEPDVENILGGAGDDYLSGSAANNRLVGNGGDDILTGGAGDDTLDGGLGGDWLRGGLGTDTADYSSRSENLRITINGRFDDGKTGERDNVFIDVENVWSGSGNDWIVGSPGHNRLEGRNGHDTITGGAGRDYYSGGGGNDVFYARDGVTDTLLDGGTGFDAAIIDRGEPTESVETVDNTAGPVAAASAPVRIAPARSARQGSVRGDYRA